MTESKPKIALFQCQWCLYSKSDQDWVDHDLPENIHLAKVPCTGRINPLYVLNAIQGGVDGLMISGCLPEQCHFKEGNLAARRQLTELGSFLDYIGFERSRLKFIWLDLQDLGRIQRELASFENELVALGPNALLATREVFPGRGAND